MEEKEFYLSVMEDIMEKENAMIGEKVALARARKAPLQISPSGEIEDYYGDGKQAVDILMQQLESVAGEKVIDSTVRNMIKSEYEPSDHDMLPERIRPGFTPSKSESSSNGFFSSLKSKLA